MKYLKNEQSMNNERTFYDDVVDEVKFLQSQNPDFLLTEYSTYSLNRTSISIIRVIDGLKKEVHAMLNHKIKDNWKEKTLKIIEQLRIEPIQYHEARYIKLKSEYLLNSNWKPVKCKSLKEIQIMVASSINDNKILTHNKQYFLSELKDLEEIAKQENKV